MKSIAHFLIFLFLVPLELWSAPMQWQKDYDELLKKYVADGGVRYAPWKANAKDMAAINNVVTAIGNSNPRELDQKEQLAFYINAYNAWTIKLVLDKYPIDSIREHSPLFGVFTGKHIRVAGERMSLRHLENEIIRKKFKDPRIHFAINCGSKSCPPLSAKSFDGEKLNQQLNAQTKAFTLSSLGVQTSPDGKKAKVSSIYKWYDDDFKQAGGTREFINKVRPDDLPADAKVEYQKYDWSLNEVK